MDRRYRSFEPSGLVTRFSYMHDKFCAKTRVQSWGSWLKIRNQQKVNSVVYLIYASGHF